MEVDLKVGLSVPACEFFHSFTVCNSGGAEGRFTIIFSKDIFVENLSAAINPCRPVNYLQFFFCRNETDSGSCSLKTLFRENICGVAKWSSDSGENVIVGQRFWGDNHFGVVNDFSGRSQTNVFNSEFKNQQFVFIERRNVEDRAR